MKKKCILTLIIATNYAISFAQMKVYDGTGKQVSSLTEKNKDIKVILPIPAEAQNHEMIQYAISIQSKTDNRAENISLGILSNGECFKEYKSSFLKDKKTVELWAVKSDDKSDFTKVFYDGDVFYFHLSGIKNISARTEQNYDIVIKSFGKDVKSYEFKDDGRGNMVKEPVYTFKLLETYKISYDAGKPAEGISSRHNTFNLPKLDQNIFSLAISPPGDAPNFGSKKPYEIFGKDYAFIKSSRNVGDHYYIHVLTMAKSQESIESMKMKVGENLARDANGYNNYQSQFHFEDRIFYPKFCVNYVESSKTEETTSGFKGKIDKFKSEMNSSGGVTEEKLKAKIAFAQSSLKWVPATIGGVSCEKIELEVYTKKELIADNTAKLYVLNPEKKDYSRMFEIYIGQKGDYIFYVMMYKHGKDKTLVGDDVRLRNEFLQGLKFI